MKAFETATSSMAYILLRILKGVEYPEEIFSEIEIFLASLENSPIEELEFFFFSIEEELLEGSYDFTEEKLRKGFKKLICPDRIREFLISRILGQER